MQVYAVLTLEQLDTTHHSYYGLGVDPLGSGVCPSCGTPRGRLAGYNEIQGSVSMLHRACRAESLGCGMHVFQVDGHLYDV